MYLIFIGKKERIIKSIYIICSLYIWNNIANDNHLATLWEYSSKYKLLSQNITTVLATDITTDVHLGSKKIKLNNKQLGRAVLRRLYNVTQPTQHNAPRSTSLIAKMINNTCIGLGIIK